MTELCAPLYRDFPPAPAKCLLCGNTDASQCPLAEAVRDESPCPDCEGSGQEHTNNYPEPVERCSRCGGSGKLAAHPLNRPLTEFERKAEEHT